MTDQTVGSYVLIEKLGEGGMGEVYLAEHKYIPRRTAIKFLLRELSGSADLVGRFFAEARAASMIKHPGIVEVLDCDVHHDGRAYIVMELLRGESLRDYLERVANAGRDELGALAIFRQIASALAAAHAQEILHRDLKPDNVFLHLPDGHPPGQPIVKVLDFGIAKLMGRSGEGGTKTRTGQLLGTPMYMSPEQCRGTKQIDSRSDVYSLGCIMYEVFCGRPPFLGEGFGDLIVAHIAEPPPEPLEAAPWIGPATRQILLACLAKDPDARPQSMEQLVSMLGQAGALEVVHLQVPVSPNVEPAGRGAPSENRPPSVPRTPARLAPTTPMPAAGAFSPRPAGTPAPTATPTGAGRTRVLPSEVNTLQEGASERFHPTLRTRRRSNKAVIAAGGIAAVALVSMVLIRLLTATAPTTKEAETARVTASASSSSPSSSASSPDDTPRAPATEWRAAPANPPPPATSVIKLTGLPPDATVSLDGRVATPPLTVPRLSGTHRLVVEAEGYQPAEVSFDGETDRTVAVAMKKVVAPATRRPVAKIRKKSEHPPHESPGFKAFTDL